MDRNHSTLFLLVDRALEGHLQELLQRWSRAGVSKRAAASLLSQELDGIEVSSETVRRWMIEAADEDDNGEGAAA